MKELAIDGRVFQYRVLHCISEYSDYDITEFFQGFITIKRKKYWIFGEEIEKKIPKFSFNLYVNIEDESYTKKEIREMIQKKIELLNRKEEIKRGEII
jgi:hypothetical protein